MKSPYLVICCLLLTILWLLLQFHHVHLSFASYMNTIRSTKFSHIKPEFRGLSSLLKETATEDRTVIITMIDREWAKPESILDLFLESFRIGERTKHLLNHLIVVALDDDQALRYCLRSHPHCYLHRYFRRRSKSLKADGLIPGWSQKALVKEILELGYNLVFTEADVMWLRNPLMHCHSENSVSVACGFSSNDHQQHHVTADNTGGLFYAKSDDTTTDMFKILNLERVLYPETENQSFCDIVKRKDVTEGLDMDVSTYANFNMKATKSEINKICTQGGIDSSFCFKFLNSIPNIATLDHSSLVRFLINFNSRKTSYLLKQFILVEKDIPDKVCSDTFDHASACFNSSLKDLAKKDYFNLSFHVTCTIDMARTCIEEMSPVVKANPQLANGVHIVDNISTITVAIVECFLRKEESC